MVYLLTSSELGGGVIGFEFTLSNVTSGMKRILSIISEYNLNIYHIESCYRRKDEYGLFIAIDFPNGEASPEKLLEEFRKEEDIMDVVMSPKFKNVIYPSKFCPMDLGGIRAVVIAEANMKGIIEGIKEEFGEEAGDAFLYRMGYEIGRRTYRLYAEELGIKDFDEAMEFLRALGRGSRWGNLKEIIKEDNKIIVRAEHLWECELQKGRVDKPASYLVKGMYVGFFEEFLNKDIKVKETKCIALGDPYCQFEITIS